MESWQEDLLFLFDGAKCEHLVFDRITQAAQRLGFDHCAYGLQVLDPVSSPRTILLNNYPDAWRRRYASAGYLAIDPTVRHARRSQKPIVWNEPLFEPARPLWEEARSFGLRFGWAQSSLDAFGGGGMLTLSRANGELSEEVLAEHEPRFRWLAHAGHMLLSRVYSQRREDAHATALTAREVEVLKWSADGKTAGEISDLLLVSENTINFHMKNAISKLGAANKTSAVVRAAMRGLFN